MNEPVTEKLFDYAYRIKCKDTDIADILGKPRSYVSKIKNGTTRLSISALQVILTDSRFANLDANWLIRGTTPGTESNATASGKKSFAQSAAGTNNTVSNITGADIKQYETEINYLKDLIKEKDKQIVLLNKLIN